MNISDRKIPFGTLVTQAREPVEDHMGVTALTPLVCSAMARWSVIEKKLDQWHTILTDADPAKRLAFDGLKGWDRRFKAVVDAAYKALLPDEADLVKAALKMAERPACKRHELAHSVWAYAEGFDEDLYLMGAEVQHASAKIIVDSKRAGRSDIKIDNSSMYECSRLVGSGELRELIKELDDAEGRMDDLMYGYTYPAHCFLEGSQDDYRRAVANDQELQERAKNIARGRR